MIVIGKLHFGPVLPEWLHGWEQLRKPEGAVVVSAFRRLVHHGRCEVVRTMLERVPEATHLFFLDDDVVPPEDAIERLLDDSLRHDLPIVTGLVTQRSGDYLPCVYRRHSQSGRYAHLTRFCEGLQQVDGCGAACLLIRADVLRAIAATGRPPFDWVGGPGGGVGEDLYFCSLAAELGFPIALDFGVRCAHLGVFEATYEAHLARVAEGGGLRFADDEVAVLSADVRPWPAAWPAKEHDA